MPSACSRSFCTKKVYPELIGAQTIIVVFAWILTSASLFHRSMLSTESKQISDNILFIGEWLHNKAYTIINYKKQKGKVFTV